ncbi:MAG: nicotinate-nucleotide adenylyltransferase [Deltaproteobacteria bacterium]|nr:nicotinate-nucleotide adenylyltransferase [Deltaproteobacteria bacterium]
MRLGIFGGTFNPVHIAHLRIAEAAREFCALEKVMFLPAAMPPHKASVSVSFAERCAMTRLAIAGNAAFEVNPLEGEREGRSYSVDTLELLHRAHPGDEFFFIIGMDSWRELETWKEWPRLFELAHIVVAPRPGYPAQTTDAGFLPIAAQNWFCYDEGTGVWRHRSGNLLIPLEEMMLDISSSRIRELAAQKLSLRYLVPEGVRGYIERRQLYRRDG